MIQVTSKKFYREIAKQDDVYLNIIGRYPYTTLFINKRSQSEAGRIVDTEDATSIYFLQTLSGEKTNENN